MFSLAKFQRIKLYWHLSHNLPSSSEALQKGNDCEAAEMKSLNSPKSHRLLDFVPSIRPSFLSVISVLVCGCLWLKNETTNERLIALESRIYYLPCLFKRMTRSSKKATPKDLYQKMGEHFSGGIAHTSGKMLMPCVLNEVNNYVLSKCYLKLAKLNDCTISVLTLVLILAKGHSQLQKAHCT